MKKKFRTTKIESLIFKDSMDPSLEYKFSDFYQYVENLGAGSFGFVVSAIDLSTNKKMALKVKLLNLLNYSLTHSLQIVNKSNSGNFTVIKNEYTILKYL